MTELMTKRTIEMDEEPENHKERINNLFKQFVEVKETIKKLNAYQRHWESHLSGLSASSWTRKMKYSVIQKRETHLRTSALEIIESVNCAEQDWRSLKLKRAQEWSEQCDNFQAQSADYANNFSRAQKDYSASSLTKDIELYREKLKVKDNEGNTLQKKLEDIEMECGLHCLRPDTDVADVSNINFAFADAKRNYSNLLHEVRVAEYILQNTQSKIKHCKMELDGHRQKQNNPAFSKPNIP